MNVTVTLNISKFKLGQLVTFKHSNLRLRFERMLTVRKKFAIYSLEYCSHRESSAEDEPTPVFLIIGFVPTTRTDVSEILLLAETGNLIVLNQDETSDEVDIMDDVYGTNPYTVFWENFLQIVS